MSRKAVILLLVVLVAFPSAQKTTAKIGNSVCGYHPIVAELLENTDLNRWLDWIEKLSGAEPVQFPGFVTFVQTRYTEAMFTGQPNARAYDYILTQVQNWYPHNNIKQQEYTFYDITAKNLILTLPGKIHPEEFVLLTAHLDDTAWNSTIAPGANDNGTGSATLLEAARLIRQYQFDRTIQLVWFTGEEAGLVGSRAFVKRYPSIDFRGVINMDMFGWDGDGDRCFEIDSDSSDLISQNIGQCFADNTSAYDLNLKYEFASTGRSDHVSFREAGVSAIGISENVTDNHLPDGCIGADRNPYYHKKEDTVSQNLTPTYAFNIAQAGLATLGALAEPLAACFTNAPQLSVVGEPPKAALLQWDAIPGAITYRVYRSSYGCEGSWQVIAETGNLDWQDSDVLEDWPYQYQVEAVGSDGVCASRPSNCVLVGPPPPPVYKKQFLPLID
jgi:Zn-dependent M28 family amino/carboxypeptidase